MSEYKYLIEAIEKKDMEDFEFWLDMESITPTMYDNGPIKSAIMENANDILTYLIELEEVDELVKSMPDPYLLLACKSGNYAMVTLLIVGYSADVNAKDSSPLKIACKEGHINIVKFLLENEDLYDPSIENNAALRYAQMNKHTDIVDELMKIKTVILKDKEMLK